MCAQETVPPSPEASPTEPAAAPPERDAIVFLAGLGTVEVGDSVDETARRLANAFDDEADAADQFVLEEGQDEDYGSAHGGRKCSTRKITILRKAGKKGAETALVDLYSLDYRKTLIGDLPERSPFRTLLQIGLTVVTLVPRLLRAVRSRGKSATEKWQSFYAWFVFLLLGLYAAVVVVAFVGTLPTVLGELGVEVGLENGAVEAQGVEAQAQALVAKASAWLAGKIEPWSAWLQIFIVWLTAIGLFFKRDIKALIEKSGVETVSATDYLSADRRKDSIAQQLSALLNHLGEKSDVSYGNIYVLTYSFGGVVAIDTLFPRGEPRRSLGLVNRLVTIACPFDFVRTYWPDYFDKRQAGYGSRSWINVYTPADVLSSDFQNVAESGEAEEAGVCLRGEADPVRPTTNICYGNDKSLDEYGRFERIRLVGFKNHTGYWEEETAGCFGSIVKQLFPEAVARPG